MLNKNKTDLTGYSKINSDSYAGNSTANRAIAHNLNIQPKLIIISTGSGAIIKLIQSGYIELVSSSTTTTQVVTAWDATNFYVGNVAHYGTSGNATGTTYHWVAFT